MRLHRFFVSEPIGDRKSVVFHDASLAHQFRNVFRFTIGGQVILFDNSGYEYHAMISELRVDSVTFSIVSKRDGESEPSRELHLFFSLIKKDKFEWIIEKGTELGVTTFCPVVSDRSEKKNINLERAEKIIREASEQSGRTILPTICEPKNLSDVLVQDFPCFAFDPRGDVFTIEHAQKYSPLGIFVGPEGGWTEREVFLFKQNNLRVYSIGTPILKAETASIAISALILLQ